VQEATAAARAELRPLADVARATREISALLDEREIVRALDERAALAHCGLLVDRLKEIESSP
jgi:hypothetical protein